MGRNELLRLLTMAAVIAVACAGAFTLGMYALNWLLAATM
jgi:hypothetical protein